MNHEPVAGDVKGEHYLFGQNACLSFPTIRQREDCQLRVLARFNPNIATELLRKEFAAFD